MYAFITLRMLEDNIWFLKTCDFGDHAIYVDIKKNNDQNRLDK